MTATRVRYLETLVGPRRVSQTRTGNAERTKGNGGTLPCAPPLARQRGQQSNTTAERSPQLDGEGNTVPEKGKKGKGEVTKGTRQQILTRERGKDFLETRPRVDRCFRPGPAVLRNYFVATLLLLLLHYYSPSRLAPPSVLLLRVWPLTPSRSVKPAGQDNERSIQPIQRDNGSKIIFEDRKHRFTSN